MEREKDNKTIKKKKSIRDILNGRILLMRRRRGDRITFFPLKFAGGASVIGKETDGCVMMCFHHHMTEHLLSEVLL